MTTETKLKSIIILAPRGTAAQLIRFFTQFNDQLICKTADSVRAVDILSRRLGDNGRLVAFGTDILVPDRLLNRFRFGAYNFHPGPPTQPGWAPANFAVYDGAGMFGATAHAMVGRPDSGAIVGVELFPLRGQMTADHLATEATAAMGRLLRRLGPHLATRAEPLAELPISWGDRRGSRAKFDRLRQVAPHLDPEERTRRARAFGVADLVHGMDLGRRAKG